MGNEGGGENPQRLKTKMGQLSDGVFMSFNFFYFHCFHYFFLKKKKTKTDNGHPFSFSIFPSLLVPPLFLLSLYPPPPYSFPNRLAVAPMDERSMGEKGSYEEEKRGRRNGSWGYSTESSSFFCLFFCPCSLLFLPLKLSSDPSVV